MSLSSRDSSFVDRTNANHAGLEHNQSLDHVEKAGKGPADTSAQDGGQRCERHDEAMQDPYTYYKAFLSSDIPFGSSHTATVIPSHDRSDTHRHITPVMDQGFDDLQPPRVRPRGTPYSLAVRLANRSDGTPLATIIEQVSVSTLNSHGSPLGVARFPSIRTVENTSPTRARAAGRSLDESALLGIEEEARQDNQFGSSTEKMLERRHRGRSDPLHSAGLSAQPFVNQEPYSSDPPQLSELEEHRLESNSLRSLWRGVFHNVLRGSRSRSQSMSSTTQTSQASILPERRPEPGHFSPRVRHQSDDGRNVSGNQDVPRASATTECSEFTTPTSCPVENHATSRTFMVTIETSAGICSPVSQIQPPTHEGTINTSPSFPPFCFPDPSRPYNVEATAATVPPVLLSARDKAPDHVLADATTLPKRSIDKCSRMDVQHPQKHTEYGVPFYRLETPSLLEVDHTHDAKPNTSFCSTLSTSYSGPVLGVDLDLLIDYDQRTERRSTTPVWFTPIEEKPSSAPTDPQNRSKRKEVRTYVPPLHSISSSALSALLPIAAAEGIIRPNYKTPQLSFFSPSGSLIHTEDTGPRKHKKSSIPSSKIPYPPPQGDSHFRRSATSTSNYDGKQTGDAHDALSAAIGLPPNRPAFLPMATPRNLTATLPGCLRYHRPEQSCIAMKGNDEPAHATTASQSSDKMTGCSGTVRRGAMKLQNGTRFVTSPKDETREKSASCMKMREASGSRSNTSSSFWPLPTGKGGKLRRRNREGVDVPQHLPPQNKNGSVPGDMGQVAGHAMRVLFCQPFDGAGRKSSGNEELRTRDSATPNARMVDSANDDEDAIAGDAAGMVGSKGRAARGRSDSGVSTGVALRVGTVGG